MAPFQIGVLGVRLSAIVIVVLCFGQHDVVLGTMRWFEASGQDSRIGWWIAFMPPLIQMATAALLWMHARKVARWLIPDLKATVSDQVESNDFLRWQTVGIICIGLWLLTRAIADAAYWLSIFLSMGDLVSELDMSSRANIFSTTVELIMGLWLLFGAQGFAKLLYKVRTARLEPKKPVDG